VKVVPERETGGGGRGWVSSLTRPLGLRRGGPEPTCAEVAAALPLILDGASEAPPATIAHVQTCLACQAELARYRKVVRLLHQLRTTEVVPPPGFAAEVLSSLEAAASREVVRSLLTGRRVAYAGAVGGAALAAAGLVMLARARTRQSDGTAAVRA
jgi:hypothetical protein